MDEANELFGIRLLSRGCLGRLGGRRGDGSFIVEAVEIAASLLEILDPFFWLW